MLIMEVKGIKKNTIMTRLDWFFPECLGLIADSPQLFPLFCLTNTCHKNQDCFGKLGKRINFTFDLFKNSDLLILYFRYRNAVSLKGGIFWRNWSQEPRFVTINPYSYQKLKELSNVFEFDFPPELINIPSEKLVQLSKTSIKLDI